MRQLVRSVILTSGPLRDRRRRVPLRRLGAVPSGVPQPGQRLGREERLDHDRSAVEHRDLRHRVQDVHRLDQPHVVPGASRSRRPAGRAVPGPRALAQCPAQSGSSTQSELGPAPRSSSNDVAALVRRMEGRGRETTPPSDLVTTSGWELDPHLPP